MLSDFNATVRQGVPLRVEFYARLDVLPRGTERPEEGAGSIEGVAILGGPELALLEKAYREQTPINEPSGRAVYVTELSYSPEPEE